MRRPVTYLMLLIMIFTGCAADNSEDNKDENKGNTYASVTYEFSLMPDEAWMNTGIVIHPYTVITITSSEEAMGDPVVQSMDPVEGFGHRGLIGKIGVDGRPFAIGRYKEIQLHADYEGKELYLGWNDSFNDADINYAQLTPLDVQVTVEETDAPPLISPEDGIWVTTQTPVFEWEDFNHAIQYVIQISPFDDFRVLEEELNTTNSFLNTAQPTIGYPTTQQLQNPLQMAEGVHYWRVRAQLNRCSTFNPCAEWTRWSAPFKMGVELGNAPEEPDIVNPTGSSFTSGEKVLFEFRQVPDPSGTYWRYRIVTTACGDTPQIDPEDPSSGNPSNWAVFQNPSPFPGGRVDVPMYYASFYTPRLTKGEWLVRIEIKDGLDNITYVDYKFSVDCE